MRAACAFLGLIVMAASGQALAQEGPNAPCVNQVNGAYDAIASADWQGRFQRTDQDAIRRIAGVWYTEIPNAQLNMVAYEYLSYQPNQIFDAQIKTCDGITNYCGHSYGTGMYAAETQADGTLFVTTNYSDNNRRNACSGGYLRFVDPNTMMNQEGNILRRVR
jgi:hypothetical protein